MSVRIFSASDLSEVNGWLGSRGLPGLSADRLPRVGFIVPGVACGFLVRTEVHGVALLDAFVANPAAPARERRAAILEVARAVLGIADGFGVRRLTLTTWSRGIGRLATELGFAPCGNGVRRMYEREAT